MHSHMCYCKPQSHVHTSTQAHTQLTTCTPSQTYRCTCINPLLTHTLTCTQHANMHLCFYTRHTLKRRIQHEQTLKRIAHTDTQRRTHRQVGAAGGFISSCIFHLSPQVALPGRQSAEKAASGLVGTGSPKFTIDFCLSLGIRTSSSESVPCGPARRKSVGGPARRKPGADSSQRAEVAQDKGSLRGADLPPARILPFQEEGQGHSTLPGKEASRRTLSLAPRVRPLLCMEPSEAASCRGHGLTPDLPLPGLNLDPLSHSCQRLSLLRLPSSPRPFTHLQTKTRLGLHENEVREACQAAEGRGS